VLRVLADLLSSIQGNLVVNLDLRTLGSSSVFGDVDGPLHLRATSMIKDVFEPVHAALLDSAASPSAGEVDFAPLDNLVEAITRSVLTEERHQERTFKERLLASRRPSVSAANHLSSCFLARAAETNAIDHILFARIADALSDCLASARVDRMYLLLDE
jgi:hypothetical protein